MSQGGHYLVSGGELAVALEEFDQRIGECEKRLAKAQETRNWAETREACRQLMRVKAERGIIECGYWRAEAVRKRLSVPLSVALGLGVGVLLAWLILEIRKVGELGL